MSEDKIKKRLITEIIIAYSASNIYNRGDVFLALAFRTVAELKCIARELNINVKLGTKDGRY
jgi:hypothetical protein